MKTHLLTALLLAALVAPTAAKDYFVAPDGDDANPGTREKPMASPVRAAKLLEAGDTLFFRGGDYKCRTNGTVGLAPSRDGEEGKPITFVNYQNEHVRIDATGSDWGVTANGHDWIVFDGLDITNRTHYGMKLSAASGRRTADGGFDYPQHVTVRNCEVHHTGSECIFAYGAEHLTIENNHLHHSGRSHGLYLQSGCHHARVRFNTSEHNRGNSGMQLNAAGAKEENYITGAVVEGNLLRGNAQGFSLMAVRDSVFRRNVLYNNCYDGPRGSGYREVILWTYGDRKAGKEGNPCRNVVFEHNTIVNTRPEHVSHLFDVKAKTSGLVLRNNILVIGRERPIMTVADDSAEGMVWQGNLYLTPAAKPVKFGGQSLPLEAFLEQIKSEKSSGNRAGDPKLADPEKGDSAPATDSPAIDAAIVSKNPTVEAAGKGPDIGAVEVGAKGQQIGCRLPWRETHAAGEPAGYGDYPLGENFDTREEIATLKDQQLRGLMGQWMDLHGEWLKMWRAHGPADPQTRRIVTRLSVIKAYVQDRATQLKAMGKSLN